MLNLLSLDSVLSHGAIGLDCGLSLSALLLLLPASFLGMERQFRLLWSRLRTVGTAEEFALMKLSDVAQVLRSFRCNAPQTLLRRLDIP